MQTITHSVLYDLSTRYLTDLKFLTFFDALHGIALNHSPHPSILSSILTMFAYSHPDFQAQHIHIDPDTFTDQVSDTLYETASLGEALRPFYGISPSIVVTPSYTYAFGITLLSTIQKHSTYPIDSTFLATAILVFEAHTYTPPLEANFPVFTTVNEAQTSFNRLFSVLSLITGLPFPELVWSHRPSRSTLPSSLTPATASAVEASHTLIAQLPHRLLRNSSYPILPQLTLTKTLESTTISAVHLGSISVPGSLHETLHRATFITGCPKVPSPLTVITESSTSFWKKLPPDVDKIIQEYVLTQAHVRPCSCIHSYRRTQNQDPSSINYIILTCEASAFNTCEFRITMTFLVITSLYDVFINEETSSEEILFHKYSQLIQSTPSHVPMHNPAPPLSSYAQLDSREPQNLKIMQEVIDTRSLYPQPLVSSPCPRPSRFWHLRLLTSLEAQRISTDSLIEFPYRHLKD